MSTSSSNFADSDPTKIARKLMQTAYNRDGLPEICIGLFLFCYGALMYLQRILPHRSAAFAVNVLALAFFVPVMGIGLPWVIKSLRRRFLLSRAGYVKSKPPSRRAVYTGIFTAIVIAILGVFVFVYVARHSHWELAAAGIFSGGLMVLIDRSLRFVFIAAFAAAAGIWLTLSNLALDLGFAILWSSLGLIFLISGTIVLLRFLRQPEGSEESSGECDA